MRLDLSADTTNLRHMADQLSPERCRQALSVSVNDTARQTRRYSRVLVGKESSIKAGAVDKGLNIPTWSSPATLSATIAGSGRPISLKEFGARQTRAGVSAKAWGRRQLYRGAFITSTGHVYHRTSRKRLPIEKMWGAGVAQVMSQNEVSAAIVNEGEKRLVINAQRQLDRYIAGAGGKGRLK